MTRNAIFKILSAAVAAMALSAGAGEVLIGDAAVARFPAGLRSMGLGTAKWMQLTNGVGNSLLCQVSRFRPITRFQV